MSRRRHQAPARPEPAIEDSGAQGVLETFLALSPDDAAGWLHLVEAARHEGTARGKALANLYARHLQTRNQVPLDSTEDLPPHIVGRVSLASTDASVVHSFDLDNLSGFREAIDVLASDGPLGGAATGPFLRFLDDQSDMAYLRRVVLVRNPSRVENLLRAAIAQGPSGGPARLLLLDLLESRGRWKDATTEAQKAVDAASPPDDLAKALLDLLELLSAQGFHEEALMTLSGPVAEKLSPTMERGLGILRASFGARALRSAEDAAYVSNRLAEIVGFVSAQADTTMSGALEEAMETYARLPEWTKLEERGLDDQPMEETLSFGLYFAFAHRSDEWPDPPAETIYRHQSQAWGFVRPIDQALHRLRHGRFQVVRSTGPGGTRRMLTVRDLLIQEELKVSFVPPTARGDELDKPGTTFRGLLVPWEGLWFVRGALEIQEDSSGPLGPRLWFVDMIHPEEGFWAAYVIEGDFGLAASAEAEHYAAPGPVTRALAQALRTTGHLPDLLVSPEGFPYVDPSGRTATSWREAPVLPMSSVIPAPTSPALLTWPHPVSLLKPWVETFGVRHVTDTQAVAKATQKFREVVTRGVARRKARRVGTVDPHG